MRVISGEAKGRRLQSVPGLQTRPATDRVRTTIFDILGNVGGYHVLDLFAGTGSLGIEALSRGAERAVFVESSVKAAAVIEANLAHLHFQDRGSVLRRDAEAFLSAAPLSSFDLIFVDPPYERGLAFLSGILVLLGRVGWMDEGAIVVAEAPKGALAPPPELRLVREKFFGRTQVTILCKV